MAERDTQSRYRETTPVESPPIGVSLVAVEHQRRVATSSRADKPPAYFFLPRDAVPARYMLWPCVCVSVSVASRSSVETAERIELVFSLAVKFELFELYYWLELYELYSK